MPGLGLSSRAIIGSFYKRLEGAFDTSWVAKVANKFMSDQESETYRWLGMVSQMRPWVGERLAQALRGNGLTIANVLYESTLDIDVDDLRRDKTGQIMVRVADLARRTNDHWAKLVTDLILAGGSTGLAYDGVTFFGTTHRFMASDDRGGDQKNVLTSTEVPELNVGTATSPTPAEFAAAMLGAISYVLTLLDDQGEPLHGDASQFLVMVPPVLLGPAVQAATKETLLASSGATAPNPLKGSGFTVDVVANPRLPAADWNDDFLLFRTDDAVKPFILQEEDGVKVQAIAEGSELEINQNRHRYGVKAIRGAGYGMWSHAFKCTFS